MKILTINTHSLIEAQYQQKLEQFVSGIVREKPDIIAMQEVNQSADEAAVEPGQLVGLVPCPENTILFRRDNHAVQVARRLREEGLSYYWTWFPVKLGYGKYDEGMAIFSRYPITDTHVCCISGCNDYKNWKTRKVLGIRTQDPLNSWFYTVHMGWWNDQEEPFEAQWECLERHLHSAKATGPVWLMGDFNSPDRIRGEGYDCVRGSGWQDTYVAAGEKDNGITVQGVIDGWREQLEAASGEAAEDIPGMRIDYIWCSYPQTVLRSRVLFNGTHEPVISDHYGVMIETEESVTL